MTYREIYQLKKKAGYPTIYKTLDKATKQRSRNLPYKGPNELAAQKYFRDQDIAKDMAFLKNPRRPVTSWENFIRITDPNYYKDLIWRRYNAEKQLNHNLDPQTAIVRDLRDKGLHWFDNFNDKNQIRPNMSLIQYPRLYKQKQNIK